MSVSLFAADDSSVGLVILLLVVLLVLCVLFGRWQRFVHWRGPESGTRGGVEAEHRRLFYDPTQNEEDDDD
jgi:hypothetical protein